MVLLFILLLLLLFFFSSCSFKEWVGVVGRCGDGGVTDAFPPDSREFLTLKAFSLAFFCTFSNTAGFKRCVFVAK